MDIQGSNTANSSASTNLSVSPFSSLSSTSPPPKNFKNINNPVSTKSKDMLSSSDEPCVSYDSKKNVTSFQPSVQKSQYFRSFRSASRRFFGMNNNNTNNNNNNNHIRRQTNFAKSNNKEVVVENHNLENLDIKNNNQANYSIENDRISNFERFTTNDINISKANSSNKFFNRSFKNLSNATKKRIFNNNLNYNDGTKSVSNLKNTNFIKQKLNNNNNNNIINKNNLQMNKEEVVDEERKNKGNSNSIWTRRKFISKSQNDLTNKSSKVTSFQVSAANKILFKPKEDTSITIKIQGQPSSERNLKQSSANSKSIDDSNYCHILFLLDIFLLDNTDF